MANRIILLVSMVLATAALAATSASAAPAADECLAQPKGPPPAGKHWYYRTNRAVQRKCWYLGDEGETIVAAPPSKQSASAAPVDRDQKIDRQPPAANARAELIDEPRVEQPPAPITLPQPETTQTAPDAATARNSVVASRWPDPSSADSTDRATMVSDPAPAPRIETPAPITSGIDMASRIETPPPVLAAAPVAPAEQPPAAVDSSSDVSFAQFAAAIVLVIVAIAGGAAVMSFASRRFARRESIGLRRMPRQVMHRDEMPRTRFGETAATRPASAAEAPERDSLRDEIEEMEQLLAMARLAREGKSSFRQGYFADAHAGEHGRGSPIL
jgi:hypothetical protein